MIIKYPNKILSTPSVDVSMKEALEIDKLLKDHIAELNWGECVGLAAPQIGINKNVFIAQGKTYINPKITFYSEKKDTKQEGCYSLKENKFDYEVERAQMIKMNYKNIRGKDKEGMFTGFEAQVLQHEYDHLLGKLCCNG